ncbi:MAG: chemotaxis protein, partial [Flavobacteriales bacterium]
ESVEGYEVTQMTRDEERLFSDLKSNLELVFKAQSAFIETEFKDKTGLIKALVKADENIYRLGKVQVKEGNRQLAISKKAIDTVELFTQIEIYFLIFLVAIVLFLVIYNPKSKVQSEE